jgi:hypothetical protein
MTMLFKLEMRRVSHHCLAKAGASEENFVYPRMRECGSMRQLNAESGSFREEAVAVAYLTARSAGACATQSDAKSRMQECRSRNI